MADLPASRERVSTNAGACLPCRIAFQEAPQGPVVVANTRWHAGLQPPDTGGLALGSGRWRSDRTAAWVAGRAFTVSVQLEGRDLRVMTMTIHSGTDRQPVIRARYRRAWQGV